MQIIFFSSDMDIINEWKSRSNMYESTSVYDLESLLGTTATLQEYVVIADYDSVASDINKMISSNTLLNNTIILERKPEIITGKMLISRGVKAYGNARMLTINYLKMIETVTENRVWTYPELTLSLSKSVKKESLSSEAIELIEHRLSEKEKEVVFCVIEGLTNDAIANKLDITQRTVKAHMSSIFSKLHINDRLALVLLLK